MKKIAVLLMSVVFASAFSTVGCAVQKKSAVQNNTKPAAVQKAKPVKNPAPDFTLSKGDGTKVKLSSLKGKTVVINFFASWCKYCILEMPGFSKTAEGLKDNKNIVFLFVDIGEDTKTVKDFLKDNKLTSIDPVYDTKGDVASLYKVSGIPRTVIVGKDGGIAKDHVGYFEESDLKDEINNQLGKK